MHCRSQCVTIVTSAVKEGERAERKEEGVHVSIHMYFPLTCAMATCVWGKHCTSVTRKKSLSDHSSGLLTFVMYWEEVGPCYLLRELSSGQERMFCGSEYWSRITVLFVALSLPVHVCMGHSAVHLRVIGKAIDSLRCSTCAGLYNWICACKSLRYFSTLSKHGFWLLCFVFSWV